MPEEYSNTIGGAGAMVKGRPLDEEGSRGWGEGGVSEANNNERYAVASVGYDGTVAV